MVGTSIWKCLKKERICLCAYSAGTIIFPFKFSAKGGYIEKQCKEMTEINFEINILISFQWGNQGQKKK